MKIPRIKIDIDSGEADVINWEDFDSMYVMWKYDVLQDIKADIDKKMEEVIKEYEEKYAQLKIKLHQKVKNGTSN